MTLSKSCRGLRNTFLSPETYFRYDTHTMDTVEIPIKVETRLTPFDQLVFGVWNSNPETTGNWRSGVTLFLEHRAFQKQVGFEYLGGIRIELPQQSRAISCQSLCNLPNLAVVSTSFFDKRENLPCYRSKDIDILPTDTKPHSCSSCMNYDLRTYLKSTFLYQIDAQSSQKTGNGSWAVEWAYSLNRKMQIKLIIEPVKQFMPKVEALPVTINGVPLTPKMQSYFKQLVLCQFSETIVVQ